MNEKMRQVVTNPLVEIRQDEFTIISFSEMRHQEMDGEHTSLNIRLDDGNDYGKSFFFDNPHEAITFFKRCLAQAERFLP